MVFRAVSATMLRSEPGTLFETVAGTITIGTQNFLCLTPQIGKLQQSMVDLKPAKDEQSIDVV